MSPKSVKALRIEALIGAKALQPLVAVAVVRGALLGIAQDAVRLGRFFELLFGLLIVGIPVGMILERQFTIRALQRRVVAVAADTQYFVVVALGGSVRSFLRYRYLHHGRPQQAPAKIVSWLVLVENGLFFHVAGLHHVDGMMDVGIKLLPFRCNRL